MSTFASCECINRMFILLVFWQNKFLKSVAIAKSSNLLHGKAHQICRCDGAKKRRKDTIGLCSSIFVALAIYGFLFSSCKKCRMTLLNGKRKTTNFIMPSDSLFPEIGRIWDWSQSWFCKWNACKFMWDFTSARPPACVPTQDRKYQITSNKYFLFSVPIARLRE